MVYKPVSTTPAASTCNSLPTLKQAVAGGLSRRSAALYDTGAQPSIRRQDLRAALGRNNGSERYRAVLPVKPRSYGGGLRQGSLRRVLEHLQAHLDQELPVTALAAVADLSPSYFSRLFKRSTGLSPHQYLMRQRIERATELLTDPGRRVAEVSWELGFSSQSHFTTVFRALAGVTPRAYQRHRNGK
jgi:AraC-like DNA-binding protein